MLNEAKQVFLGFLMLITIGGYAMNLNLAWPWGDVCSPPQTPYLAFYSSQSDDMMFDKGKEIKMIFHF